MSANFTFEHLVIIALAAAVVILWLTGRSKQKKLLLNLDAAQIRHEQALEKERTARQSALDAQRDQYENLLNGEKAEAGQYRAEVAENLNKLMPYGERLLMRTWRRLFEDQAFRDFTVYHQFQFEHEGRARKIDFFVISPKGLFVLESKMWKGITYIYSSACRDIFSQTMYDAFGVGSSQQVRVFNAQRDVDDSRKIRVSSYSNPVGQVRDYSLRLKNVLRVEQISNAVVFCSGADYEVRFDHELLSSRRLDTFTSLIADQDDNLKQFFLDLPDVQIDLKRMNELCGDRSRFDRGFRLDVNNYQQGPFDQM